MHSRQCTTSKINGRYIILNYSYIEIICCWSNIRARPIVMGTKALYLSFFGFSVYLFLKYIYIFCFNGLNHYPRLLQKFKTNKEDPFQGNFYSSCVCSFWLPPIEIIDLLFCCSVPNGTDTYTKDIYELEYW